MADDGRDPDYYLDMFLRQLQGWPDAQERRQRAVAARRRKLKWAAAASLTLVIGLAATVVGVSRPTAGERAFLAATEPAGLSDGELLAKGYAECQASTHLETPLSRAAIEHLCPEIRVQVQAEWVEADRAAEADARAAEAQRDAAAAAAAERADGAVQKEVVARSVAVLCSDLDALLGPAAWERTFVIDRAFPDFAEAWGTAFPANAFCHQTGLQNEDGWPVLADFVPLTEAVTPVEAGILASGSFNAVQYAYEKCVEHGTTRSSADWPVSDTQLPEALNALALCPNHPDAPTWNQGIAELHTQRAAADAFERKAATGTAIASGPYVVGSGDGQMRPGTWRTVSTETLAGCYWERTSGSTGEIIDNNYSSAESQITVTVHGGERFMSSGCGRWEKVG